MAHPTLAAGSRQHCSFGFNVSPRLAANFSIGLMAGEITRRFMALGLTPQDAPSGHANPEIKIIGVGAGMDRKLIAVDVWATLGAHAVEGAAVNTEVAQAFKVAARDGGLSVERIAGGLGDCADLTEWFRTPTGLLVFGDGNISQVRRLSNLVNRRPVNQGVTGEETAALATVCATYEPYEAGSPPREAPVTGHGAGGSAAAIFGTGDVEQSTTPGQAGTAPRVIPFPSFNLGISATTLKIIAGGTIALLGVVIVGYTARGVAGLIREVK